MADVGNLNVRINLDALGFQNGISKINTEMRKLQAEFKLANAQLGQHGSELDKLRLKSEHLAKETQLQREKVEALKETHQKSVEAKGADAKATQELETKLNLAQAKLATMEQNLKEVNDQLTIQTSSWGKLSRELEAAGGKLQSVGKKLEQAGKELSMKVTAPLMGLGAAAVKIGSDFEAGMSEVRAISGYKYFNGGDRQASAHYFVDDKGILQLVEDSQASWHCGDGKGKYGITNQNSIGVEICINADGDYEKAVNNTVDLVKHLMDKHSIPPERVVRHYDASRKICPATMRENNWARWQAFKKSLTEQPMDDLAKALKVLVDRGIINTPDYWQQNARVGKTVNGAYAAALIEKVAAFLEKNPPP